MPDSLRNRAMAQELRLVLRWLQWLVFLGLSPGAGVLYMVINRLRRRLKERT
jgi:hypothetical protein